MYRALRPLLFALDAERAHALTLTLLRAARRLVLRRPRPLISARGPAHLMGLEFANRVGLAAGFDKDGASVDALGSLGFGFIEVGTVTPRPQPGNARPRVRRIPEARAIINRMGFPNDGVAAACARLARRRYRGICGLNIGKNATTPIERAVEDYTACLGAASAGVDYLAINVSSPNTSGLRELQAEQHLAPLLEALLEARARLTAASGRRLPLLVKLSPDLSLADLAATAQVVSALHIDGVIATNSTVQRPGRLEHGEEPGGLSGAPLFPLALATVRRLRELLGPRITIIGVGGVTSLETAQEMLAAGADLIQIYTGLVYEGPRLVRQLAQL